MSDLISRQAALDAIQQRADRIDSVYSAFWEGLIIAQDIVKNIPSVEPERKKGKWIVHDYALGRERYECAECKGRCDLEYNFCPNCGAEMTR